jgi:4-amino-4-deoxy-L-arabinose transferase-like glycosyltransferase
LEVLGRRVTPSSLAEEHLLPLTPPLARLTPRGGLQRGSVVAVQGPGATALALGLVAGPSAAGSWVVGVGAPEVGLLAAAELGIDLERMVVVDAPPRAQWGAVVAAVAEAFDVVLVRHHHPVRPGDARRLTARVRERGGVLVQLPGRSGAWPDAPDLTFTLSAPDWRGVAGNAPGAGHLSARLVQVTVDGRRAAARGRSASLWLPGPDGEIALAAPFPGLGHRNGGETSQRSEPAVLEQAG